MTFPLESEATARRRILNICQDNSRNLVEIIRSLALMTDSLAKRKSHEAKGHYNEMLRLFEQSRKSKSDLLQEIASLGLFLIDREDFLRLTFRLSEIADTAEGVAFRLVNAWERKNVGDAKFLNGVSQLASLILEETSKMRETLMTLTFNPGKALEMASTVEEVERRIDTTHRMLDVDILSSKIAVPTLITLKDILERLEKMADLIVDALDQIRVLAISS